MRRRARKTENVWDTLIIPALLLWVVVLTGCGDANIGRVSGVVRLDGQPLPKATVEFEPESGSPSYGITDEGGGYELMYLPDKPGAEVGKHVVRVTTYDWITNPDGSKTEVSERVPPQYNVDSILTFEVNTGSQIIDLDLQSRAE